MFQYYMHAFYIQLHSVSLVVSYCSLARHLTTHSIVLFDCAEQVDFQTNQSVVVFSVDSSTSVSYEISIVDDPLYEMNESFVVVMYSRDNDVRVAVQEIATITIVDDDGEL